MKIKTALFLVVVALCVHAQSSFASGPSAADLSTKYSAENRMDICTNYNPCNTCKPVNAPKSMEIMSWQQLYFLQAKHDFFLKQRRLQQLEEQRQRFIKEQHARQLNEQAQREAELNQAIAQETENTVAQQMHQHAHSQNQHSALLQALNQPAVQNEAPNPEERCIFFPPTPPLDSISPVNPPAQASKQTATSLPGTPLQKPLLLRQQTIVASMPRNKSLRQLALTP